MNRIVPVLLVVSVLSSCFGVETRVDLTSASSGTIELTYRVLRTVVELGNVDDGARLFPLPVSKEDFERTAGAIEGLRLLSWSRRDDRDDVVIRAKLHFTSIEALGALYGIGLTGSVGIPAVSVTEESGLTVYRQLLSPGNPQGLSQVGDEVLESFFSDYAFTFVVSVPGRIITASVGEKDSSGRRVLLSVPVKDLIRRTDPLVMVVSWR